MAIKNIISGLLMLTLITGCDSQQEKKNDNTSCIPNTANITIDGDLADWQNKGLSIAIYANEYGEVNLQNFAASCKLGWNDKGLVFAADVQDDTLFEGQAAYHQNDGLEFFLSNQKGSDHILQYLVSAGITAKHAEPRVKKNNFALHKIEANYQPVNCASTVTKNGYAIEMLIPFSELPDTFSKKDPLFIQFYINDKDQMYGSKFKSSWHYFSDTYRDHFALNKAVLSPSKSQITAHHFVKAYTVDDQNLVFKCFADQQQAGAKAMVILPEDTAVCTLKDMEAYAFCEITLKDQLDSYTQAAANVFIDGQLVDIVSVYGMHQKYVNKTPKNRFEMDIRAFEKDDRNNPKPKGAVLFLGSSSIRLWKSLEEDFPELEIINRGFGGSTNADALHFFDRIVKPYKPAKIVYFEGSNDLGGGLSPQQVTDSTKKFIEKVEKELPGTEIILLSVKVSVSRKHLVSKVLETNKMIEKMASNYDFVTYVDVCPPLLDENNKVRHELFSADSTHMNRKGYQTWVNILRPVLIED